tara:strand:- start:1878 stop:2084 length:207 start_codon:yes stop_codon:yes gene_type:complete
MKIDLDKKGLIILVNGSQPNYELFENQIIKLCGQFDPNRGWQWSEHELKKLGKEHLYRIYELCRNSWN